MLDKFPKTRPKLPKKIKKIHSVHYKLNRKGQTTATSLAQRMESWMHRQVAKDLIDDPYDIKKTTLEVGAGTLNQLEYEPKVGPYDIVEPWSDIFANSSHLKRVRNIYSDISEVPVSFKYDRITTVATFEHICNLPDVVARCGLLLKNNGALRVSIPSEGTLLWKLGWKLTTGLEFKLKYGQNYELIMKHEHVNTAREIEDVLGSFFKDIKYKVFGINKSISFYRFYECLNPRIEKCLEFGEQ